MFLIKVARDSIHFNKDYKEHLQGANVLNTYMPPIYEKKTGDVEDGMFVECTYIGYGITEQGELIDPYLKSKTITSKIQEPYVSFKEVRQLQPLRLLTPYYQRKYLYNYTPTEVECDNCHSRFLHTELREVEYNGWEDYYFVENVCPICGEPECCEIEFERISDTECEKHLTNK